MSHDPNTKSPGSDLSAGAAPDMGDDERTLIVDLSEELQAERKLAEAAPKPASQPQGGLSHMFSSDPENARYAVPSETEGDALLDVLFDDAQRNEDEVTPARPTPSPIMPVMPRPAPPRPITPAPVALAAPAELEPEAHERHDTPQAHELAAQALRGELPTLEAINVAAAADLEDAEADDIEFADLADVDDVVEPPVALSSPPPEPLSGERDAVVHLIDTHEREGWAARATWLHAEAGLVEDAAQRAQALLTVSELYAMAGEEARARSTAQEARELSAGSPLAQRQVRGLAARDADWATTLQVLEAETRLMPTPASRAHGALMSAEIARLITSDEAEASRRVDSAMRANPADPRAHVQRMAEQLASVDASAVNKLRLPDAPELATLASAWAQVLRHRGFGLDSAASPETGYEAMLRARAALAESDVAQAVASLAALSEVRGAEWTVAALAAPRKELRATAESALRRATSGTHSAAALRGLAARAIERGDASAVNAAIDGSDSTAFAPADRLILTTLMGGPSASVEPWLEPTAKDAELKTIAVAVSAALSDPARAERTRVTLGADRPHAEIELGRTLSMVSGAGGGASPGDDDAVRARGHAALAHAVAALREADPSSGVARALSFELDLETGNTEAIAAAAANLSDRGETDRDASLAAVVLLGGGQDDDSAGQAIERACSIDPAHEGAARARIARSRGDDAAAILAELAQATEEATRGSLLFVEAALRAASSTPDGEVDSWILRAAELDPALPFAFQLGEQRARSAANREELVEWIRRRREASSDPIARAHDLTREALGAAGEGSAGPLLEEALRARPADAGLRELLERLSTEPPTDGGAWRAARANEAVGVEGARLALEAALELEREGNFEQAAVMAQRATTMGDTTLAPLAINRLALAGHGTDGLVDTLMAQARSLATPEERAEMYHRLAELDELGRGDAASSLLFRRTILEELPGHLPTLRRIASVLISEGRDEELEPIALELAKVQSGGEAVAHAALSARLRLRAAGWDETREPVMLAYAQQPRGLWALRQAAAHARARDKHALALEADQELATRTERPSEIATLLLRAAQSATSMQDLNGAKELIARALEASPEHLVLLLARARVSEELGEFVDAASALEDAAAVSMSADERKLSSYGAAMLWLDKVDDRARGRLALESAAAIDPSYADVFERLRAIYVADDARVELAALLEQRLASITDPAERIEMEVLRSRALVEIGDPDSAKRALARALEANPDHVDALSVFAELCTSELDWSGAEQAWIRLGRLVADPATQAAIYLRLGEIYDEHLPDAERAELAYGEILKRSPTDPVARERLVALYVRSGDSARALEQQAILIGAAEQPEDKCRRTVELAEIYEAAGETKKAETTLLQARKAWPKDNAALSGLARLYQRTEQASSAQVLLDRAVNDARRALGTGRFEPNLFETIATVAELRGRQDAALIAKATVSALDGLAVDVSGVGSASGDPTLDDLLAPDVMTPAFRDLLQRTGSLLDLAAPYDLSSVRATPLLPQQAALGTRVRDLAQAYGLEQVQVLTSALLGPTCMAATAHPAVLVIGQPLIAAGREDILTFLVHRALKLLQTNTAALARTAPIDLWPLLAAYFKVLAPSFVPQGVDAGRLREFSARLQSAAPAHVDPQLGILASEVAGAIGNRASTLNTVVNGWGARAGLLAVGDPNAALTAIAWAGGHVNAPPPSGKERTTWIGRNAEARELIVFSVSDAYADARARLGS
jgi:tetratricopeptide (TPR) repeat protein